MASYQSNQAYRPHATSKKPLHNRWYFWVLIIVAVIVIVPMGIDLSEQGSSPPTNSNNANSGEEPKSNSSPAANMKWSKSYYESIVSAEIDLNANYVGGTMFSDIVDAVGPPEATNEMDFDGITTVTANWAYASWGDAKYVDITILYDKASGMVVSKMYFEL
jgi:hypothetical protein